jgi:hypothetical protein
MTTIVSPGRSGQGDKIATRVTGHATHQGELMGIPPTGKEVTIPGIVVNRISEGRIEEGWLNYDALGLMQQLGVIPRPEQSEEASSTLEGASDPSPLAP